MDPLPQEFQFTHPEFAYEATPNFQPAIKVSVFFRKREGITDEAFFKHWATVHADLAVASQAFQSHILRYAQHHQTPEMRGYAASLGEKVLDFDACAQLWVRTWDDWLAFCNSEEYAAALGDDCKRFMELPMTYMVGYENLVVGDTSTVLGGKDGVSTKAADISCVSRK
ncbi:Dimeric alpha-beta barrel [Penicillium macrosclerotiorum]|uniref:Dimeric alpha-beta barrel n=1 Tax=Penicillium macrosclerotiorum TaxID=303699 RepID=UPI002547ADA2|nr:Dimeric alpha-beta barrel [Penicillium macrosclerotiorum]KAJ5683451.1 Dimeric alpha-beta barrel [Penicillium macrosclerotiorum]